MTEVGTLCTSPQRFGHRDVYTQIQRLQADLYRFGVQMLPRVNETTEQYLEQELIPCLEDSLKLVLEARETVLRQI